MIDCFYLFIYFMITLNLFSKCFFMLLSSGFSETGFQTFPMFLKYT